MKTRTGNLFKRNGIYYVRWRVNGKLFMRTTGETELKKAKTKRDEILAPFLAGREVDVLRNVSARIEGRTAEIEQWDENKNPPLKIAEAWREYTKALNRPDSGPETLRQYHSHYRQFAGWIKQEAATVTTLRDVTPKIAEEYAQQLVSRGLSANSFNKQVNFLALLFRVLHAKARMRRDGNPWQGIQRKRMIPNSRRELTTDELMRVCAAAEGEMRLLFAIGLYTGLRLGDCATLRWCEVDLRRGSIQRVPNKTARRKGTAVVVPVHASVRAMLQDIPGTGRGAYVLPGIAAGYLHDKGKITRRVQKHFNVCGIRTAKVGTGPGTGKRAVVEVGFHSLRHTFVSLCREANAPLAVVEAIVGHASPAMTRHYTHIGEAAATSAVAALPDITGKAKPAPSSGCIITVPAARLRDLADQLTSENAPETKGALLALCVECGLHP
jgi:integrase